MMTRYILDKNGYLAGITEGAEELENFTTIPPIYVDGKLPQFVNGKWVDASSLPMLSPVEFKMLFTSQERVAIKANTDAAVQDFFELINDPRLTQVDRNLQSVKDAIAYLASINLIKEARAGEILS